ncbi:MAG: hypothetical protein KDC00_03770 [Flavobacteriales bacterium]|nr:hypothetical protein [Flavobacteriales bacterium]
MRYLLRWFAFKEVDQHTIIMFTSAFILLSGLFFADPALPVAATNVDTDAMVFSLGGPPSIRIAGLSGGDVSAEQFASARTVDLAGCQPDAKNVSLTFVTTDGKGIEKNVNDEGPEIEAAMRSMITALPKGATFLVEVEVKDSKGKTWKVPTASFIWIG